MSLAEELLADLDEDDDEMLEEDMKPETKDIKELEEALPDTTDYSSVFALAKLTQSERYQRLVGELDKQLASTDPVVLTSPLEADPHYRLIVDLSHLTSDIDAEIHVVHKFVRDKYEKRFPELESLVPLPLDYMATARLLGNDINTKGQNKDFLAQILAPATCIVVSVTASTSQGKPLEMDELAAVNEACDLAQKLQQDRINMHRLVEMRMALIAPNLCAMLGAGTSAQLVSQAGGLAPLARMPACNILVLGQQKRTLQGFSSAAVLRHAGFIFFHPAVQRMPPDLRRKAARIVASKVTLAARVDAQHESADGKIGRQFGEQVTQKLEKLLEPPPVKASKALPKPLDVASKKRGGRRMRKMKERMGMTELRKKANRINFGELSEDILQTDIGFTLGQVKTGNAAGGRIRTGVVNQNSKARMSQKLQRQLEKQRAISAGGATSVRSRAAGTASSVTFTPVQGIEIVNPALLAAERVAGASTSSNYFSSTAGFVKVQTPLPR